MDGEWTKGTCSARNNAGKEPSRTAMYRDPQKKKHLLGRKFKKNVDWLLKFMRLILKRYKYFYSKDFFLHKKSDQEWSISTRAVLAFSIMYSFL